MRHEWDKRTGECSRCGLFRRFRQSASMRRRDHGMPVRFIEVSRDELKWTKITRGFALPPCKEKDA